MIDAKRQELLQVLAEMSEAFPNWRMGQMIANLATSANGTDVSAIWDSEDDELTEVARRLIARRRESANVEPSATR